MWQCCHCRDTEISVAESRSDNALEGQNRRREEEHGVDSSSSFASSLNYLQTNRSISDVFDCHCDDGVNCSDCRYGYDYGCSGVCGCDDDCDGFDYDYDDYDCDCDYDDPFHCDFGLLAHPPCSPSSPSSLPESPPAPTPSPSCYCPTRHPVRHKQTRGCRAPLACCCAQTRSLLWRREPEILKRSAADSPSCRCLKRGRTSFDRRLDSTRRQRLRSSSPSPSRSNSRTRRAPRTSSRPGPCTRVPQSPSSPPSPSRPKPELAALEAPFARSPGRTSRAGRRTACSPA